MRLLYFSPVYAGSYAQRPHFMVRALLDWGIESVLWVNPYPCRLPRWGDLRRAGASAEQGTRLDPRIHVLNVPALSIEPLPLGSWLNRQLLGRDAGAESSNLRWAEWSILPVGQTFLSARKALGKADKNVCPTVNNICPAVRNVCPTVVKRTA